MGLVPCQDLHRLGFLLHSLGLFYERLDFLVILSLHPMTALPQSSIETQLLLASSEDGSAETKGIHSRLSGNLARGYGVSASLGSIALSCATSASLRKLLQDGWRVAHPTNRFHYGLPSARLLTVLALVSHNSSHSTVLQDCLNFRETPGRGRMSRMLVYKVSTGLQLKLIDLAAKPEVQLPLGLATPDLLISPPMPGSIESVPVAKCCARWTSHHEEGLESGDHLPSLGSHVSPREIPRVSSFVLT